MIINLKDAPSGCGARFLFAAICLGLPETFLFPGKWDKLGTTFAILHAILLSCATGTQRPVAYIFATPPVPLKPVSKTPRKYIVFGILQSVLRKLPHLNFATGVDV